MDDSRYSVSRILWQCRRGMLELDCLLQTFVKKHYQCLTDQEKKVFLAILDLPDQQLFDYFMGYNQPGEQDVRLMLERIRNAMQDQSDAAS